MRYTTVPRYDTVLHDWKTAYCKEQGIKAKDLEGYGPVPNEILLDYAIYDADTAYRLRMEQEPLIDHDYEGNNCRETFWESMLTIPVILEMHCTGLPCDRTRIDYLTGVFMKARDRQEATIRTWAKWPEFNIRSVMQVREFLFGEQYNGKITKDGSIVRLRPPKGKTLQLDPVIDTSKPPKQWWDIRARGAEKEHSPATGKMVLGMLAQECDNERDQINWIRDYRFLDQVLKSVLRPPKLSATGQPERDYIDEDTDSDEVFENFTAGAAYNFGRDNMGGVIYNAGLASVICGDGRVRTHL
jgi:hypothetical protein